ncbi:MAG TPA: hypothetical protein VII56_01290 [Rhizomicrobium sp.]
MSKKKRRPGDGTKLEGAGAKIPNRELHHWWPKGLSKYWADQDGLVSQLRYCGKLHRSTPKTFGAMTNAHAIKLKGPWNSTIEPMFNFPDTNLPRIVGGILEALSVAYSADGNRAHGDRAIRPYAISGEDQDALSEGLASLVIRSPGYREFIRLNTNHYRERFGLPGIDGRDNLIAGQIHQWYSTAVASFQSANVVFLYSKAQEFIFGEGYLNNFQGTSYTFNLRAVVPLAPELAVICFSGSGRTPPSRCCSLCATPEDVAAINELSQVYTKEFVYFRSQQPTTLEVFSRNEFLQREYHRDAVVEGIIQAVREARVSR